MLKKILIINLLILGSVYFSFAQTEITGKVINTKNQKTIKAASVSAFGDNGVTSTVTDLNGKFTLKIQKEANYIIVKAIGFKKKRIEMSQVTIPLTIYLERGIKKRKKE